MICHIIKYEMKLQLRSLVFWLALALSLLMFYTEVWGLGNQYIHMHDAAQSGMLQNGEDFLESLKNPISQQFGPVFADRMGIVLSFVMVFVMGFVFDRDRLAKNTEIVSAKPVRSWHYVLGKYLAVMSLVIGFVALTWLATVFLTAQSSDALGTTWVMQHLTTPALLLLLPTLLYAGAVALLLAATLRVGAAVVPIYMAYFIASFTGFGMKVGNDYFSLGTFVVRSDGWDNWLAVTRGQWNLLLTNRLLYAGLLFVFGALAIWLYHRRREGLGPGGAFRG